MQNGSVCANELQKNSAQQEAQQNPARDVEQEYQLGHCAPLDTSFVLVTFAISFAISIVVAFIARQV